LSSGMSIPDPRPGKDKNPLSALVMWELDGGFLLSLAVCRDKCFSGLDSY
jgi:hypothetical protein